MIFTQDSATSADGKMYSFWAGGHVVYFECVLVVNLILLRWTHNFTGWNEFVIFLQIASFFILVWLDSIWLTNGAIAYFWEEYMSSWTAVLGCLLIAFI